MNPLEGENSFFIGRVRVRMVNLGRLLVCILRTMTKKVIPILGNSRVQRESWLRLCNVKLLTADRQTDRQTNAGHYITSFAEVKSTTVGDQRF